MWTLPGFEVEKLPATVDDVREKGPLCPVCHQHVPWEEVSPLAFRWCPHCGVSVRESWWPTGPAGVIALALGFTIARASGLREWGFLLVWLPIALVGSEVLRAIARRITPPTLVLGDVRPRKPDSADRDSE